MDSATILTLLVTVGLFAVPVLVYSSSRARSTRSRADEQAALDARADIKRLLEQTELSTQSILKQAERDAETLRKEAAVEAREKAHAIASEAEAQLRERRHEILSLEQALADKTRALADRLTTSERLEQDLRLRERRIVESEKGVAANLARGEQLVVERQRELQRVAGLSAEEARDLLLKQLESDVRRDAANLVKRLETEARETAAARAQQIVVDAIQRSAAEHTIETTVSVVDLPSDDMKGRIIGREGRNIRALETATGVELIVDDTPGAIILSSFDPLRREIARQAIERLIADGRIHPARIEEIVTKVKVDMEETVRREGEEAAYELGLYDLHPEVLRLMGRLKFRTSYGQNVLNHSKEVAFLAGIMARELGLNAQVATRAAFLHDIGKAIDRRPPGDSPRTGARLPQEARRIGPGPARGRGPPHGHRLAVARGDARPGRRRDFSRQARRPARHPRVVRETAGEAGGHRRLLPGGVKGVRAASRPRNPDSGRERANLGRGDGLAVQGHRPPDRKRARVPGPDQGHGHSRDASC